MKILFLSQIVPYPPFGGVLQRGYNLIREISRKNDIHLLAFVHPDILKTEEVIENAKKELKKYCRGVEFFDLWVKKSNIRKNIGLAFGTFSTLPFSVTAQRSSKFKERVVKLSENNQFDLIHYDTISLCQFNPGQPRIPRTLTHHNIESKLMERRSKFEKSALARYYLSLQAKKLKQLEISECGKFDVNIVVSESDRYELGKIALNANISIVPNGVDTNYFIPLREDDSPSLIYTGGMNMFANRDAVLYFVKEIFPKISMRVPNVKFFAVGQDPPPELKRLSDTDKKIVVTGYVNDIRHLVGAATVYVVPLRVGGGTRLKVLDAMAMGKAIVSTSIGCEGLSVNNDVNILVADTPSAFAEKTVELMRNPYRRKSLGEMARKLVEIEYDWSIIGRNLQIIYENAISTKQHLKSANMVGIV